MGIPGIGRRRGVPAMASIPAAGVARAARAALVTAIALAGFSAGCAASTRHVIWAIGDGEKIERDDLDNPYRNANAVWDGEQVILFAARNEIIAFQVIVEARGGRIERLAASLPELVRDGGGARIGYRSPDPDPTRSVGRDIQLFSVHYMQVTQPTTAPWIFRPGSLAAPPDPRGWKPVQLVPENATPGRGGFPLAVPAGSGQALWIEIYVPRDVPAGEYRGTVRVDVDGDRTAVPVRLTVFDFTLPDAATMHAMVFYDGDQPALYHGRNLDPAYHRMAHRHRIELVHGYDVASARAALGRLRGDDYTPAHGYAGPGEGVGDRIVPATFYGPGRAYDDRASAHRTADAWMAFLDEHLPRAITFLYLPDEPRPDQFPRIRRIADNVRSSPGPGRRLPLLVTRGYTDELDGAIDIWTAGPHSYDIAVAERERARGRRYWLYHGWRPGSGAILIDSPATDPRATIWACFKHGIDVYFYWHAVHWRHNAQKQGERVQDVWAEPITFDNRGQPGRAPADQGFANGDGVLLYPGEDRLHPEQDRGIAGPIATVQLANLRRGLQDHLYLTLARELGLDRAVDAALARMVAQVLSDAGDTIQFPQHGDPYAGARYRLGEAIEKARRLRRARRGGAAALDGSPSAP